MPLWHPEIRIHLFTITSTKPNPLNLLVLPTGCEYVIIPFTLHTFSGYMLHISSYILYLITYILYIIYYILYLSSKSQISIDASLSYLQPES